MLSNAIENILSVPRVEVGKVDWTQKKDYGKVPKYIRERKDRIEEEDRMRERMRR